MRHGLYLHAADIKCLEVFHIKCQRQIRRLNHVRNAEVTSIPSRSHLGQVLDLLIGWRTSQTRPRPSSSMLSLGDPTDWGWRWCPQSRWLNQFHRDNKIPRTDLWRQEPSHALDRGLQLRGHMVSARARGYNGVWGCVPAGSRDTAPHWGLWCPSSPNLKAFLAFIYLTESDICHWWEIFLYIISRSCIIDRRSLNGNGKH